MLPWTTVTKRVLFAVVALYLVVSVIFGVVALTPDPNEAVVADRATTSGPAVNHNETAAQQRVSDAVAAYREARNLDDPLGQRYVRWLVDVTTLDWGTSFESQAPVLDIVQRALWKTLAYVIPAVLFALVGGVGLGLYLAMNPDSLLDRLLTPVFSVAHGMPNFWMAEVALLFGLAEFGGWLFALPAESVFLPAAILGLTLLASQLRFTRAECREYVNTEFVKLLRAKGASNLRIARHVLKNAAPPLVSVFVVDLLGVLVVGVFILETVIGIDGIGSVGISAIHDRDMPVIIGITVVVATAGVVGNLLQDLASLWIDPRTAD